MQRTVLAAVLVIAALVPGWVHAQQEAEFVVIAHPSVASDEVARKDLEKIFLKKRSKWANGVSAQPIDQKITAPVREAFTRSVLGKSMKEVDSYWQGQVFAGRQAPPPTVKSDREVVEYVAATAGAVGYVAVGTSLSGVTQLAVVD